MGLGFTLFWLALCLLLGWVCGLLGFDLSGIVVAYCSFLFVWVYVCCFNYEFLFVCFGRRCGCLFCGILVLYLLLRVTCLLVVCVVANLACRF